MQNLIANVSIPVDLCCSYSHAPRKHHLTRRPNVDGWNWLTQHLGELADGHGLVIPFGCKAVPLQVAERGRNPQGGENFRGPGKTAGDREQSRVLFAESRPF